ncbi:hypothetical protein JOD24_002806 [Kroppenstedtia sanguinis]
MMWNKKMKPIRPAGHWKNGKTLFLIWAGATFLILSASLAALYPIQHRIQEIRLEEAQAQTHRHQHREILQPGFQAPTAPTSEELASLQEKVPVSAEPAHLLTALQQAVASSGTQWEKFTTAEKASELAEEAEGKNKQDQRSGEEGKPKEPVPLPKLPEGSQLHPRWADLYIRGTEEQLLTLFSNLHQMKRVVSVQGWEYVDTKGESPGRIRIRLTWYEYQDPALKKLPPPPDQQTS